MVNDITYLEKIVNSIHEKQATDELEKAYTTATNAETLFNELSIITALQYWNNEIDFERGDWVMNRLFGYWVSATNNKLPELLFEIYLAFDAGEFYHDDDRSIHPSEKYTRPEIGDMLRRQKLI